MNTAIEALGLDRRADREIGLQIEQVSGYRPEPEVTVIDADYEFERYAARFYGVAEVLSATDMARNPRTRRTVIDDKLAFYRSHPSAEFVLVISQRRMEVQMHLRGTDGVWYQPTPLVAAADTLELPGIGTVCSLAAIYKGIKLADPEDV